MDDARGGPVPRALLALVLLVGSAVAQDRAAPEGLAPLPGPEEGHGVPTYVVASEEEQAAILEALGVEPLSQALVFGEDGTPYDVVETSGGTVRFDISAFFGEGP